MQPTPRAFPPSISQRNSWQFLCLLCLFVFTLLPVGSTSPAAFAQAAAQQACGLPANQIKEATQTTLPLPNSSRLVQGQKYYSRSGDYYLLFQTDGNLVVNDALDKRIWGLDKIFPNVKSIGCITVAADSNLVALASNGGFLWSALTKDPDPTAQLILNPRGALQLTSNGRGVLWSSNGDTKTEIDLLQLDAVSCGQGLPLLLNNMYKHPEDPKTAPSGKRAWVDVYKEFTEKHLPSCKNVGAFIKTHQGEPMLSQVEKTIAASGVAGWDNYFSGKLGIVLQGERIAPYCPALHLSQFDCVDASRRISGSIAGAQKVLDLLKNVKCMPDYGWAYCRKLADPKITIMGASTVSQSALDNVEKIYTDMTKRLTSAYPKNKLDGYVVYLTNKGPWAEVSKLSPVGTMWLDPKTGANRGDELRGGSNINFLWIDEQMICKRGVQTRKDAYAAGKTTTPDDDAERTFDQVIHEFAHTIDSRYGLRSKITTAFPGNTPEEQFAWAVQDKFGAPKTNFTEAQRTFVNEIFGSATTTFSCKDYTP